MIVYLLFPYLSFIKCKSSSTGGAAKKVWRRTASSQAVFSFRASRQWSLHHIILLKLMQRTGLLMPNLQKHPEDYNELYSGMFFFLLLFYPAFIVAFYCIRWLPVPLQKMGKWLCFCAFPAFRPTECSPRRTVQPPCNCVDRIVSCLLLTCMTSTCLTGQRASKVPWLSEACGTWVNV